MSLFFWKTSFYIRRRLQISVFRFSMPLTTLPHYTYLVTTAVAQLGAKCFPHWYRSWAIRCAWNKLVVLVRVASITVVRDIITWGFKTCRHGKWNDQTTLDQNIQGTVAFGPFVQKSEKYSRLHSLKCHTMEHAQNN